MSMSSLVCVLLIEASTELMLLLWTKKVQFISYLSSSLLSIAKLIIRFVINMTISVIEKTSTQVLPDLSCSLSSSTSIVFSLGSFNSEVVPSWVAIDSNTGLLTITSPEVEQDTNYNFYVNAMITDLTLQTQKQIKLTVKDWSTWGSQTAKSLSITVQSIIGVVMIVSVITSMLNVSSGSNFWLLINEAQLFFLLLLARAYIPDDVKLVITGLKFALNLPFYFSFNSMPAYNSVIDNFNFELSNNSLSYVGVSSDSSVYNTAPFFVFTLIVIVCHLVVIVLIQLLRKCKIDWKWGWVVKKMIWIFEKIYNLLFFLATTFELGLKYNWIFNMNMTVNCSTTFCIFFE